MLRVPPQPAGHLFLFYVICITNVDCLLYIQDICLTNVYSLLYMYDSLYIVIIYYLYVYTCITNLYCLLYIACSRSPQEHTAIMIITIIHMI